MSATPAAYELEASGGEIVEQVIRPTGLVDPVLHVKPARGQAAIGLVGFNADESSAQFFCHNRRCPRTKKRIQHDITFARTGKDELGDQFLRFLRRVIRVLRH